MIESGPTPGGRVRLAVEPDFDLGSLRVRPSTREVVHDGVRLVLQPRVMQVLVVLATSGGRIVPREELTERCWEGRVVSDGALNRVISQIRKLADLDQQRSFALETVSRVGYGLRRPQGDDAPALPVSPAPWPAPRRRTLILGAAALAVAVGAGGAAWIALRRPARLRIAVLPFDTADPALRVLAEGLSEDLITSLLSVPDIDVVARSSTFMLAGARKPEAGRQLGATHVLDGSVEREGDHVRINVHLIDARRQSTIWSQQYDAPLAELFSTQSRIARDATGVLELAVTDGRLSEPHVDPVAYRLFVEGRDHLNKDPREAIPKLVEAVDRAPGFSRGWSMLGAAYVAVQGTIDTAAYTPIARQSARAAAERALALDPKNAQGWTALAAAYDRAGAWSRIEGYALNALRFEPSSAEALYGAGNFYADVGWNDVSIRHLQRARILDPLNPLAPFLLLRILEAAGDESRVDGLLAQAEARWPANRSLWRFSMRRAIWKRRLNQAADLLQRTPTGAEGDAAYFSDLMACRRDPNSPRLATFTTPASGGPIPFTWPIFIFALGMLGQTDACVALIRRIYLSQAGLQQAPTWVLHQSMVRPVWHDAGLREVVERLGLDRFWSARGRGPDQAPAFR
jgi:TolB-like protein/DNA-binding winged helix-turn-helix (wHTH) protein